MDEIFGNGTDLAETSNIEHYIISAIDIIICVFGLTGNVLSMIVVVYNPGLKIASTIFMFNLAMADFLFLLSLPFAVTNILMKAWIFKEFMCKIFFGLFGINLFASVYTLVAMSLDRYIAICCMRWNTKRTRQNSIICCVLIWIVATLLTLPLLLYSQLDETETMCLLEWPSGNSSAPPFIYYTLTLGFIIPLILITFFYTSIVVRLHTQSPSLADQPSGNKRRRNRKVTVVVFCLILAFFLCWLPYWCMQLVIVIETKHERISRGAMLGYHIATVLYSCNSAINPVLYGFFSNKFRQGVLHVFKCAQNGRRDGTYHSSRMTTILQTLRITKSSSKRRQEQLPAETANSKLSLKTKEQTHLLSSNEKTNEQK